MSAPTRVSAMPWGNVYFGVIHRAGLPDETLDGPDGKPLRFATSVEALRAAGDSAGLPVGTRHNPSPLDKLGIEGWKRDRIERARRQAAETRRMAEEVFGISEGVSGLPAPKPRAFVVERRRRGT